MLKRILMFFGLAAPCKRSPTYWNSSHDKNVAASTRRLEKIIEIGRSKGGIASQIAYLRKVDAYVFEEMLLTAISKKNHVIVRNLRYSGDGGIDGEFTLNGNRILVQAKRYKRFVSTQHIRDFGVICEKAGVRGIFVHTGRTPKTAWDAAGEAVEIISGKKLIALLVPATEFKTPARVAQSNLQPN